LAIVDFILSLLTSTLERAFYRFYRFTTSPRPNVINPLPGPLRLRRVSKSASRLYDDGFTFSWCPVSVVLAASVRSETKMNPKKRGKNRERSLISQERRRSGRMHQFRITDDYRQIDISILLLPFFILGSFERVRSYAVCRSPDRRTRTETTNAPGYDSRESRIVDCERSSTGQKPQAWEGTTG